MQKKNVIEKYKLPEEIRFCRKCAMSNQRPRIGFDENGICSACHYAEFKRQQIDWNQREQELLALCDRFRSSDGSHDVIVPVSGGKDGGFVAHQLKHKYGMNPLTVTWSPLVYTDIGRKNLDNFIRSGFDHILGTSGGEVTRRLTHLAFKELGDPFLPFIYGVKNFPLQIAVQRNISLIMYGENGEVEYGGDMKNAFQPTFEIQDQDKHYFSGLSPAYWSEHGLTDADLHLFKAPAYEKILANKTEMHFFGYYKFWDPQENFYYCMENTGFTPNPERSEGTYSKYASLDDQLDGFHYFLGFIKFGIGRATSDAAHEIRDGKIDREEAKALVKRYDGEFPKKYFKVFLDYVDISEDEFSQVVDSWRSEHIWEKSGSDWKLKHTLYDE